MEVGDWLERGKKFVIMKILIANIKSRFMERIIKILKMQGDML